MLILYCIIIICIFRYERKIFLFPGNTLIYIRKVKTNPEENNMSGIKIKIYPKGLGTKVYRVLAITEDTTFRELCDYIGYTFDLDYFSHMYEFVLGKPGRFTECVSMQEFDHNMFEFSIPKTIYFHYDFGRDLYFAITFMSGGYTGEINGTYKELKAVGERNFF